MRNRAVFLSPTVSSDSSSYIVISRTSSISKGARRAPQLTRIDFKVLPETNCQGLFNQIHKKGARRDVYKRQGFKNTLLVGNGIALALQLVLMGKACHCLLYTSQRENALQNGPTLNQAAGAGLAFLVPLLVLQRCV